MQILERDNTASRPETDMWLSGKVPVSYVQGLGLRSQHGKQTKTGRTVEVAQLVKSSVCKHEEPSSMLRTCVKNPAPEMCAYNLNSGEVDTRGSPPGLTNIKSSGRCPDSVRALVLKDKVESN